LPRKNAAAVELGRLGGRVRVPKGFATMDAKLAKIAGWRSCAGNPHILPDLRQAVAVWTPGTEALPRPAYAAFLARSKQVPNVVLS